MIKRIIEISTPARLSLYKSQMLVERHGVDAETVPVEDIGVLVLDHRGIIYTQGLLVACFENKTAVLVCDSKHLPSAIFLPLDANTLHAKTVCEQSRAAVPVKKKLWKELVKAKIKAQHAVLKLAGAPESPLKGFAARVRSGDPDNLEAQAARYYWQALFGPDFRRDRELEGVNALLNYGYAIIRGAVARAAAGAGLHPALGVHHSNQYNSFCLADDLVEPLRPFVDIQVYHLVKAERPSMRLEKEQRKRLIEVLTHTCRIGNRKLPLMSAMHPYAASIRRVIAGEDFMPEIPVL